MVKLTGTQQLDGLAVLQLPMRTGLQTRSLRLAASTALVGGVLGLVVLASQPASAQVVTTDTAGNSTTDRRFGNTSSITYNAPVTGFGIAPQNTLGGIAVTTNSSVTVDAGNTPTVGGNAAVSITATGGVLKYDANGNVQNLGTGLGVDLIQNGPAGTVTLNANAAILSTTDIGVRVKANDAAAGDVKVTTAAVTALAGVHAVEVRSAATAGNIEVTTNGAVAGVTNGVVAELTKSGSTGNITVTTNGTVAGQVGIAGGGTGTYSITTNDTVTSAANGIAMLLANAGKVVVNANANINANGGVGIFIQANTATSITSMDITVKAGAIVTASGNGIETNSGTSTGLTTINVNGEVIAGAASTGVKGTSTAGGITVNVGANGKIDPVIGTDLTTGTGALTVNNAGITIGTKIGVQLNSTGAAPAGDVTIAQTGTGSIEGTAEQGVKINTVDANAKITGAGAATTITGGTNGVEITTTGAGNISIADNTIKGGTNGIVALQDKTATGGISITGAGAVEGTAGTAIDARIKNAASTSAILVDRTGTVTGVNGIVAVNSGTSATSKVTVSTSGAVTTTTGVGIQTTTNGSGLNTVTIGAGGVTTNSGTFGVTATSNGGGDVLINGTGVVKNTTNTAIDASVNGATGGITVTGGVGATAEAAGKKGIQATIFNAANTNAIVVDTTGVINIGGGALGVGIDAQTVGGGNVTVGTAANKIGDINNTGAASTGTGINAKTTGAGNIEINTAAGKSIGAAGAEFATGITITNAGAGTVAITSDGNIFADNGIVANSASTGFLKVGGTGNVTSNAGIGISASITNAASAAAVDVTSIGTITGKTFGIIATTAGTGKVNVNVGGSVTGTAGAAIRADQGNAAGDLITVTTQAGQTLKSSTGSGIFASTVGTGGILLNNAATISSAAAPNTLLNGLSALSFGTAGGDVTVTTSDSIGTAADRASNNGIVASISKATATGNLTVNVDGTANVFGAKEGILASQSGSGSLKVQGTSTGTIDSSTKQGISATIANAASTADLTVNLAANVIGGTSGIVAENQGKGAVIVTPGGNVTGNNGDAINALQSNAAGTGLVTVTTQAGKAVKASTGSGIIATNNGTGGILITNAADIASAGAASTLANGIKASSTATGGDVTINNSGNIGSAADIAQANGIQVDVTNAASIGNALVNLNAGDITAKLQGVVVSQFGLGSVTVTGTGTGTITATAGSGIFASIFNAANTQNVLVDTKAAQVTGVTRGIFAQTAGTGAVMVQPAGSVTATNGDAIRAVQTNAAGLGLTTITTQAGNTLLASNGIGINAIQVGKGGVSVTNAATIGSAAGPNTITDGIVVADSGTAGDVTVTTSGSIGAVADRPTATGVNASMTDAAATGNVTVNVDGTANVFGTTNGVLATTAGTGKVSVQGTSTGVIDANTGEGVKATITNAANTSDILVNLAAGVTGGTTGILAKNDGKGAVNITGTGAVTGGKDGISAIATQAGAVTVSGTGAVVANGGTGIIASSAGANVTVTPASNVTATGGAGINATNTGAAANAATINVTVAAGKIVNATGGNGIKTDLGISTGTSTVTINGEVKAAGGFAGVQQISKGGSNVLNVTAAGKIDPLIGADQSSIDGANTINNAGLIEGDTIGAKQTATGTGPNTIINGGTINGKANEGVLSTTNSGAILVTNTGTITGATTGILATSTTGNITIDGAGTAITGTAARGIDAKTGGNITITNASAVTGGTDGISGNVTGAAGILKIATTSKVTAGAVGVLATSAGKFDISNTSTINAATAAKLAGAGALGGTFTNSGSLIGATTGFAMASAGTVALANSGTISGPTAISTTAGTLNATNSGTINGAISTAGGVTNLTNSGVWNNTKAGGPAASTVTSLANTGTINMVNGAVGDSVVVTGAFTGGAGSKINVDINLSQAAGAGRADTVTAASGASSATINLTALPGNRVTLTQPIDVVTAPGLTVTNLGPLPSLSTLLSGYALVQNPAVPGQYQVTSFFNSGPVSGAVAGLSGMVTGLQAGFHQPASAIISRPDNCSPNQLMGGPFIRLNGGDTRIGNSSNGSAGGGGGSFGANTTAKSNFAGFQTGLDMGVCNINNTGWNVHAGLMGGYVETSTHALTGSASGGLNTITRTTAKVEVPFFGAYAFVTNNDFTMEFNVRKDWFKAKVGSSDVATGQSFVAPNTKVNGEGWSFNTSASYRFYLPSGWYIEPGAGVSFGRVSFGQLGLDPALFAGIGGGAGSLTIGTSRSILGRAGVNIGAPVIQVTDKFVVVPFAHAALWHEFGKATRSSAVITTAGVTDSYNVSTSRVGTFGQVGAGLQFKVLDTPFLGFVRGDVRFGSNITGKAFNAGVRLQF